MLKTLDKVKKGIAQVMEWLCVIFVSGCTLLSVISVILRYCVGVVFIQTEELITFLFIAVVFLGIVPVMCRKEHISVALIQNALPRPVRKTLIVVQYLIIVLVQVLFLYASYYWISTNLGFLTPGLHIPYFVIYLVVPVSAFLTGIIAVIDLVEIIVTPSSAALFDKEEKKE